MVAARTLLPDQTAVDVLESYAAHLGIPVHTPPHADYPMWDGSALKEPVNAEDWAHEIAHWLLASPKQRGMVDYGWGFDFQFLGSEDPDVLGSLPWPTEEDAPDASEEISACLLGFAFLVRVGEKAPYDGYGFYEDAGIDSDQPAWKLTGNVYAERREVQPWVRDFDRWLAGQLSL